MEARTRQVTLPDHPGKILRRELEARGWSQQELAQIVGCHRQTISKIASGKQGITPEMALALGAAFGNDPSDWLQWSAAYELALAEPDLDAIKRRAQIYELAPIRQMQKRGWLPETHDVESLEASLECFFGCPIGESKSLPLAARRTVKLAELNAAERAWCFRARQLATAVPANGVFSHRRLLNLEPRLRRLAAYPGEARKLPRLLMDGGIRFVIVEPLPGAKIDGAAFWLDEHSPVIAVSVRYDRIDAFWFTVMHEFAHIKHGDQLSVDAGLLTDEGTGISVPLAEDDAERLANEAASDILVPREELDSFVRRLGPYYSAERIVQFAHKVRIHPGIIVGQLQHRGEVGYTALRDFLVKIRHIVIETALTDGWGQSISPGTA